MRRGAIALLLLAACAGGCSSTVVGLARPQAQPPTTVTRDSGAPSVPPSTAPPAPSAPPPPAPPPPASSGVAACFEANCQLSVSGTVNIPMDRRLGIVSFSVSVTGGTVNVNAAFPDGGGGASLSGAGTTASVNQITIRVVSVSGDAAVIALSAPKPG